MEDLSIRKTTKDKVLKCILYFFVYSFLGWIIETIYALFAHGYFVKRGFLYGPICPIYGFGAIALILLTKKIYKKPFIKFLIATIAFTLFEYVVSIMLENIFGLRWWDYSNDFLNIQGRISLIYSLFWGLIGWILLEKLHPIIKNKVEKINEIKGNNIQLIFAITLIIILMCDTVFSVIKYLN